MAKKIKKMVPRVRYRLQDQSTDHQRSETIPGTLRIYSPVQCAAMTPTLPTNSAGGYNLDDQRIISEYNQRGISSDSAQTARRSGGDDMTITDRQQQQQQQHMSYGKNGSYSSSTSAGALVSASSSSYQTSISSSNSKGGNSSNNAGYGGMQQQQYMYFKQQQQPQQQHPALFTSTSSNTTYTTNSSNNNSNSHLKTPSISQASALQTAKNLQTELAIHSHDPSKKTKVIAKHILGGSNVNGFFRCLTSVQRQRKQRAKRQRKSEEGVLIHTTLGGANTSTNTNTNAGMARVGDTIIPANSPPGGQQQQQQAQSPKAKVSKTGDIAEMEEIKDAMNTRLIQKMRDEFQYGMEFCQVVRSALIGILKVVDPDNSQGYTEDMPSPPVFAAPLPLPPSMTAIHVTPTNHVSSSNNSNQIWLQQQNSSSRNSMHMNINTNINALQLQPDPGPEMQMQMQSRRNNMNMNINDNMKNVNMTADTVEEGNPNGSTRRQPHGQNPNNNSSNNNFSIIMDPFDPTQRRRLSQAETAYLAFESTRYRTLYQGDLVVTKVKLTTGTNNNSNSNSNNNGSWILGQVLRNWFWPEDGSSTSTGTNTSSSTSHTHSYLDLMRMTPAKRASLPVFREQVQIVTAKVDSNGNIQQHGAPTRTYSLHRTQVLPLPRTQTQTPNDNESAQWSSRHRYVDNSTRVLAMYPPSSNNNNNNNNATTGSFYLGTVVDSGTWCRGSEDVCVVRFDGDTANAGKGRHVLAKFISTVPKEELVMMQHQQQQKQNRSGSTTHPLAKNNRRTSSLTSSQQTTNTNTNTNTNLGINTIINTNSSFYAQHVVGGPYNNNNNNNNSSPSNSNTSTSSNTNTIGVGLRAANPVQAQQSSSHNHNTMNVNNTNPTTIACTGINHAAGGNIGSQMFGGQQQQPGGGSNRNVGNNTMTTQRQQQQTQQQQQQNYQFDAGMNMNMGMNVNNMDINMNNMGINMNNMGMNMNNMGMTMNTGARNYGNHGNNDMRLSPSSSKGRKRGSGA